MKRMDKRDCRALAVSNEKNRCRARRFALEALEQRVLLTIDLFGYDCYVADSAHWGETVDVFAQIRNVGTEAATPFQVQWYLSKDNIGSADDLLLLRTDGNTVFDHYNHAGIAAQSYGPDFTVELQLPARLPDGFSGEKSHVIMKTDSANQVNEGNENNNFGQVGDSLDQALVTITDVHTATKPAAPTDLKAQDEASHTAATGIDVTWSVPVEPVDYIKVYRSDWLNGSWGDPITTLDGTTTEYVDTTVDHSRMYYYLARSVKSGEESADSNRASAVSVNDSAPAPPLNLTLVDMGDGLHVRAKWDKVAGAAGYYVYYSPAEIQAAIRNGKPAVEKAEVSGGKTEFVVPAQGPYTYVAVAAYDGKGNESGYYVAYTEPIYYAILERKCRADVFPAAPSGFAGRVEGGSFDLYWASNGEEDLAGYNVYRNGNSSPINSVLIVKDENWYRDDMFSTSGTAYYELEAVDDDGNVSQTRAKFMVAEAPVSAVLFSGYTNGLFDRNNWLGAFATTYFNEHVAPAVDMVKTLPSAYAESFSLVSDADIENGTLSARGFKVLILPNAMSLSHLECTRIDTFVRSGGLVFADGGTSLHDPNPSPQGRWRLDADYHLYYGLPGLGVTHDPLESVEAYCWNMDQTDPSSELLRGVFEKSELEPSDPNSVEYPIALKNGQSSQLFTLQDTSVEPVSLTPGQNAKTVTTWASVGKDAEGPDGIVQAFVTNKYGLGNSVYSTGKFFSGWKFTSQSPWWASEDAEPSQNAEKLLWNALYQFAPVEISRQDLSVWWIRSQMRETTGLVDSYENGDLPIYGTDTASLYDQALAVMALTQYGQEQDAQQILRGLMKQQVSQSDPRVGARGAFPWTSSATSGQPYDPSKFVVGANSWVVMAANQYLMSKPKAQWTAFENQVLAMARSAADWILTFQGEDGAVTGGIGFTKEDGTPIDEKDQRYPWASTEHNLDAWSALHYLGLLVGGAEGKQYTAAADKIKNWIEGTMWLGDEGRFAQGMKYDTGSPVLDRGKVLDVNSWGLLVLLDRNYLPGLSWSDQFCRNQQAWQGPDSKWLPMIGVDGFDFDGRDKDTVWTEGTEGVALVALVALAYWSIGYSTEGDYFHEQVARLHDVAGDGGIPYTTNLGTIYFDEASLSVQYPSVAGTAWFLFYEKQFNPFRPNLWHNLANAYDVDGNGRVEPLDVLTLINYINAHPGNTALPSPPAWPPPPPYYDVNNDGQITPLDVLWVINYINSHPSASGEGEAVSRIASSDEPPCLPSFEVPLVPLLTIAAAPEVGSGTATNNADSWPATWPPLVSVQPHDGQPPSASPMATPAVRDSLLRPATRPVMLDDLDGVLAPFDGVLRDIADDVARGWGQDGGAP